MSDKTELQDACIGVLGVLKHVTLGLYCWITTLSFDGWLPVMVSKSRVVSKSVAQNLVDVLIPFFLFLVARRKIVHCERNVGVQEWLTIEWQRSSSLRPVDTLDKNSTSNLGDSFAVAGLFYRTSVHSINIYRTEAIVAQISNRK